jgi:predicted AAA+ superfamily ATPase
MVIPRHLQPVLEDRARRFPIVAVVGPLQSGKTTLARTTFPDHQAVDLEDPDHRDHAARDPRDFLAQVRTRIAATTVATINATAVAAAGPTASATASVERPTGLIIDGAQYGGRLVPYLVEEVERDGRPGRFVLVGFSGGPDAPWAAPELAGRAAALHLLPLSFREVTRRRPLAFEAFARKTARIRRARDGTADLLSTLHTGGFPALHDRSVDRNVDRNAWFAGHLQTIIAQAVPSLGWERRRSAFEQFVRLCGGWSGQVVNLSALAADCGITHPTARRWLAALEASGVATLLPADSRRFRKRLVRRPRLHVLDSGLLCFLLRIRTPEDLRTHASRGAVFEAWVVAEVLKGHRNAGRHPAVTHWRDRRGREIDLLVETPAGPVAVEIRSGTTVARDFFASLAHWRKLTGDSRSPAVLIHGGERASFQQGFSAAPWWDL